MNYACYADLRNQVEDSGPVFTATTGQFFKREPIIVYILEGLLWKQCGNGLKESEAGDQNTRLKSNPTVQEPNKEEIGKTGKFLNIENVTKSHSDNSNAEVRKKIISRFLAQVTREIMMRLTQEIHPVSPEYLQFNTQGR